MSATPGEQSIHQRLLLWGKWSRGRYASLSTVSVFGKGSTLPTLPISDDDALLIDAAVCRLRLRNHSAWRVVKMYYIEGLRDHRIAEIFRRSRNWALQKRHEGVNWIDGNLDSIERTNI